MKAVDRLNFALLRKVLRPPCQTEATPSTRTACITSITDFGLTFPKNAEPNFYFDAVEFKINFFPRQREQALLNVTFVMPWKTNGFE